MDISCPGSFGKDFFDMLKSIEFGDLVRIFFQFEGLPGSPLLDLFEIRLGCCLGFNLQGDK